MSIAQEDISELEEDFGERLSVDNEGPNSASTAAELAQFRRDWEAEVRRKHRSTSREELSPAVSSSKDSSDAQLPKPTKFVETQLPNHSIADRTLLVSSSNSVKRKLLAYGVPKGYTSGEREEEEPTDDVSTQIRLLRRAVQTYAQAVGSERSGDLDKALILYRKAFRLDAGADKLYERASTALQQEVDLPEGKVRGRVDILIESEEVRTAIFKAVQGDDFRYEALIRQQERNQLDNATEKPSTSSNYNQSARSSQYGRDELSSLIDKLSAQSGGERNYHQMPFEALDEEQPVPIARLPEEVLLHILSFIAAPKGRRGAKITSSQTEAANEDAIEKEEKVQRRAVGVGIVLAGPDYMSIEQLGRTCWRFRLLTRAWSVWRLIVRETYFPPQIPPKMPLPTLVKQHDNDWRTTFVDQPRVRLNGAYIAACHYTRAGMHEDNIWVRVVHVVEFYRSLRFLPDGRTLSLLTTDAPSQTVRRMEPSLKIKGFAIGTWTLHPQGLADDELYSRPAGPKIVVDDLKDKTMSRYTFRLILKLDKTSRGKWNRLEVLEYESINLESGEICPLPLNHKKPFHFSTVCSYGI